MLTDLSQEWIVLLDKLIYLLGAVGMFEVYVMKSVCEGTWVSPVHMLWFCWYNKSSLISVLYNHSPVTIFHELAGTVTIFMVGTILTL